MYYQVRMIHFLKLRLGLRQLLFMQHSTRTLHFGRDPLGRRSLLLHRPTKENPYFLLTSVSAGSNVGYDLEELSTENLYTIDVASLTSLAVEGVSHRFHGGVVPSN